MQLEILGALYPKVRNIFLLNNEWIFVSFHCLRTCKFNIWGNIAAASEAENILKTSAHHFFSST